MARQKTSRACRFCGQSDLFWKSFNGSWRLADDIGNLHKCDPARRAEYKGSGSPDLPEDTKAHGMPEDSGDPIPQPTAEALESMVKAATEGKGQPAEGQGSEQGKGMAQQVKAKSEGQIPGEGEGETQQQPEPNPEGDDLYSKVRGHVLKDIDGKQGVMLDALCDAVGQEFTKVGAEIGALKQADATLAQALTQIDNRIAAAVKAHVEKPTKIIVKMPEGKPDVELEGERPEMADLLVAYRTAQQSGMGVMLVGPAGSGKTTAGEKLSKALGLSYFPFSVGAQTSKSDLVGYQDAHGRTVRPVFREAFEFGGLFLLDEVDAGNANVLTQLNAAIGNRYCSFPDGVVKAHESFGVVAAANTYGNGASRLYVGRNQLDAATLNRFVVINWDYDHKLEKALGDPAWVERIHKLRAIQESLGLRVVISTRAVIVGTALLKAGMTQKKMENLVLWNAMSEDDREKLTQASR